MMKKSLIYFFVLLFFVFTSCKNEEAKNQHDLMTKESPLLEKGKILFEGKGTCIACHKPNAKIIGPSIIEIATIYKDKNADMVAFLKGKANPIVNPLQYEVMKTNLNITKNMSDEELRALEFYFYSFIQPD